MLAVLLPLCLWLVANAAVWLFAINDIPSSAVQRDMATPEPVLLAATELVQGTPCAPHAYTVAQAPAYVRVTWEARRSSTNPRAYFVGALAQQSGRLLAVWQVEGGATARLYDEGCPGLPAGTPAQLAEAASVFASAQSGG
jgi:hypothetical protein